MIFNTRLGTEDILLHGAIKNLSKLSISLAASADKEKVKQFCSAIDEHLSQSDGSKGDIQKLLDKANTVEPSDLEDLNSKKEFQSIINLLNYMHSLSSEAPKGSAKEKKKFKQGSKNKQEILDSVAVLNSQLEDDDEEEDDNNVPSTITQDHLDRGVGNKLKKKR